MFVSLKTTFHFCKIVTMIKKKIQREVSNVVKKYFSSQYTDSLSVFEDISQHLEGIELDAKDLSHLRKLLRLFFLGQLTGLPSLRCIMDSFGITSNNEQVKYNKLCKKLSNNNLHKMFEFAFEQHLQIVFKDFCKKHSCKWSRDLVTAVLDDSVFKQWLQQGDASTAYDECYGRFFSGQVGHVVYGFQVVTFGLVIDDIFYPLYFESVKKVAAQYDEKGKKIPESEKATIKVAKKLVSKWHIFVKKLKAKGLDIPSIHFSCDSGYSDIELSNCCADAGLVYISVPKMNHIITYNNDKIKLSDWIETVFIPLENDHKKSEKDLKKAEKTPFYYRFTAYYKCQKRVVTWLAFRLNGSNKVTLIYTTDKNIKGITLRRHWFARTYIEQFFKILKHTMKIQNSITTSKHKFELKLLRFAFVALHIQLLVKTIKRKLPKYKKRGFGFIRMFIQSDKTILDLLHENIITK